MMFQTKPSFPLFMPSSLVIGSWPTSQPNSPASQKSPTLATGFNFLADLGLSEALDLLNVLYGIRDLVNAFDSFQHGEPQAPPIKMIIFARNLNQHELLSLPDLSEVLYFQDQSPGSQPAPLRSALELYEMCRLCAFVFQMTVLLPNLHDNIDVTTPYAQRVKQCLQIATTDLRLHEDPMYHDVLLWVTLMAAWLIRDTYLYDWFADFLFDNLNAGRVGRAGGNPHYASLWPSVRAIMASFLWLDSECNAPCSAIWDEVEAMQALDGICVNMLSTAQDAQIPAQARKHTTRLKAQHQSPESKS